MIRKVRAQTFGTRIQKTVIVHVRSDALGIARSHTIHSEHISVSAPITARCSDVDCRRNNMYISYRFAYERDKQKDEGIIEK
jgi:hypothetical protein